MMNAIILACLMAGAVSAYFAVGLSLLYFRERYLETEQLDSLDVWLWPISLLVAAGRGLFYLSDNLRIVSRVQSLAREQRKNKTHRLKVG